MVSPWGNEDTQFFFELTPERILEAVEESEIRCTGRCLTLNSMENRVYEVEIESDSTPHPMRIVKFYRPGRWSKDQILEEHSFLQDLIEAEVPAIAPLKFKDGSTLKCLPNANIFYTVFPKQGGRNPDELNDSELEQIGRLLARLHQVGEKRRAKHRIQLNPQTYGLDHLTYLIKSKSIPVEYELKYKSLVEKICEASVPLFKNVSFQRIHGDSHLGNLIFGRNGFAWVDFDDMCVGPCVQDLWLIVPGRDERSRIQREILLEGYNQMRPFDRNSLRLIEPLRALRFIHFTAWIARRWNDPIFPKTFIHYGTPKYWEEQMTDLEEQLELIANSNFS